MVQSLQALNNRFWQGLDPKKPERLSKVLAALYCFHIAPPTDVFHCEFTVHPADHDRIFGAFPELQLLEKLVGRDIPFHFDANTGSLITMDNTAYHKHLIFDLAVEMRIGLRSLHTHPGSVGALAQKVQSWDTRPADSGTIRDQNGKPTAKTTGAAWAFGVPPDRNATFLVDFAGPHSNAPSRHAQYITAHGARTVISLQLSFTTTAWLGDEANYKHMADNTTVWVWTKVDGKAEPVVEREPLSTPGGQIKLWLSDFVHMAEGNDLPSEFVRPPYDVAERAANITIPYSVMLESLKKSSHIRWMPTGDKPLPSNDKVNNKRPTNNGVPGGKRFFSVAAHGVPGPRKTAAGMALDPAVAARRASAASVGRFSTRFLRAFHK